MDEKDKELAKEISTEVVSQMKKSMPKTSIFTMIKDLISIALIIVVVIFGVKIYNGLGFNGPKEVAPVEEHDVTLDNKGFLGFTVADFEDVVVGAATKEALLMVTEQEVSVVTTITQTGLFNWNVFTKNQPVTYYGDAEYTVNLKDITGQSISVDNDTNTVTIKVPHVEMHKVAFNPTKTKLGDPDKGLLAFGDIKLDQDQQKEVETGAIEKLTSRAKEADLMNKADEYAIYVLRDFFETAIGSVAKTYRVKIEFAD